jgi:hypothetical protein
MFYFDVIIPEFFPHANSMWNSFSSKGTLNSSYLYSMFSEVVRSIFPAAQVTNYGFRTFQGSHTQNKHWEKAVFTSTEMKKKFYNISNKSQENLEIIEEINQENGFISSFEDGINSVLTNDNSFQNNNENNNDNNKNSSISFLDVNQILSIIEHQYWQDGTYKFLCLMKNNEEKTFLARDLIGRSDLLNFYWTKIRGNNFTPAWEKSRSNKRKSPTKKRKTIQSSSEEEEIEKEGQSSSEEEEIDMDLILEEELREMYAEPAVMKILNDNDDEDSENEEEEFFLEDVEIQEEYFVEKIEAVQQNQQGQFEFKVFWKGFPQSTWEPFENINETEALEFFSSKFNELLNGTEIDQSETDQSEKEIEMEMELEKEISTKEKKRKEISKEICDNKKKGKEEKNEDEEEEENEILKIEERNLFIQFQIYIPKSSEIVWIPLEEMTYNEQFFHFLHDSKVRLEDLEERAEELLEKRVKNTKLVQKSLSLDFIIEKEKEKEIEEEELMNKKKKKKN